MDVFGDKYGFSYDVCDLYLFDVLIGLIINGRLIFRLCNF